MARNWMQDWVAQGWLVVANDLRRKRAYGLSAIPEDQQSNKRKTVAFATVHFKLRKQVLNLRHPLSDDILTVVKLPVEFRCFYVMR